MNSLVLLSGGADSLWTLARVLRDTDDHVRALHLSTHDDGQRRWLGAAQRQACERAVVYLRRHYRDFEFEVADMSAGNDVFVMYWSGMAAICLNQAMVRRTDRIWTGTCVEEEESDIHAHCGLGLIESLFWPTWNHPHTKGMIAKGCACDDVTTPVFCRPSEIVSKHDMMAELPLELLQMSWSCYFPEPDGTGGWLRCGKCDKCEIRIRYDLPTREVV